MEVSRSSNGTNPSASVGGFVVFFKLLETTRPLDLPIVVLEAATAAVCRMDDGLVGGGGAFLVPTNPKRGFAVEVVGFLTGSGIGFDVFGFDKAAAAALDFTVDGGLGRFVVDGLGSFFGAASASRMAIVFSYSSCAPLLFSNVVLQTSPAHSG